MQPQTHAMPLFRPACVEALSDGVFAIVMTLLVLEIAIPRLALPAGEAELQQALLDLVPEFFRSPAHAQPGSSDRLPAGERLKGKKDSLEASRPSTSSPAS